MYILHDHLLQKLRLPGSDFFFSSRRRHTRLVGDWSSDVCSSDLTTVWENLLITSGDAIRGFAGAKLKISWSDFYEGYNVPCNLCAGIRNQVLFIEKKEDAFQPTIQQAMGEVKDLRVSTAK